MGNILFQSPGQQCTVVLETLDGYQRADSPIIPSISRIIFPNLALAANYPQPMTKLSTGLYLFNFTIPTGATAVGSYIVDIVWTDPNTGNPAQMYYQVVVNASAGNYSVISGG